MVVRNGLTDAMNIDGEAFGAARLLESVTQLNPLPLSEMIRTLMAELDRWRGEADINDDVSVLALGVA